MQNVHCESPRNNTTCNKSIGKRKTIYLFEIFKQLFKRLFMVGLFGLTKTTNICGRFMLMMAKNQYNTVK